MSTILVGTDALPAGKPARRAASTWDNWGRLLVLPYLLVFVLF